MAAFKAGNIPGPGRPKGSRNKDTKALQLMVTRFAKREFKQIMEDWAHLTHGQRVNLFFKEMLHFCLPKQQAISSEEDFRKLSDEELQQMASELRKGVVDTDTKDNAKLKAI